MSVSIQCSPDGFAADRTTETPDRLPADPARVASEQRQLALEPIGEIRPEPGVRLELERVGRLVEGDPCPERNERHAEGPRRRPDVLLDEQEPAGHLLGRQERKVVLAEDLRCP